MLSLLDSFVSIVKRMLNTIQRSWPLKTEFCIEKENVKCKPIAKPENVLMPPLHINLGLMKQFVKKLDERSVAFTLIKNFSKVVRSKG